MASISLKEFSIPRCQDVGLQGYLLWVQEQPVLEQQECAGFAERAASGEREAYGPLLLSGVRMVLSLAKLHQGRGPSFPALIDEGNEALGEAAERYVARGEFSLSFMSYIVWPIRDRMRLSIVAALQGWQDERSALIESVDPIGSIDEEVALVERLRAKEQDAIDSMVTHFLPYVPAVVELICEEEGADALRDVLAPLAEEAMGQALQTYRADTFQEQGWTLPLRTHVCLCLYRTLRNYVKKRGVEAPTPRPDKDPKATNPGNGVG